MIFLKPDNSRKILVVGHRNPDTDSICSAIAYAALKNMIDEGSYAAVRAGQISNETRFVLDKFNIKEPEYISYVGAQVRDMDISFFDDVDSTMTLQEAYRIMHENKIVSLCITDEAGFLKGLITMGDIANSTMDVYDNRIVSKAKTSFESIAKTIGGQIITGDKNKIFDRGKVFIGAANPDLMGEFAEEGDVVILGNRYDSQICAIEMNASALIVCADTKIFDTIKRLAEERNCIIIATPYDTYTVSRLINHSMPIGYFMTDAQELIKFSTEDFVDDIKKIMGDQRYRNFPVVDMEGKYYGMISRRSLLNLRKKEVIMVDHNEKTQAVEGITEAEVLEIIDHHKLGAIETVNPVYFRNQPLGCTATIISQMYAENGIEIEKNIAGLLCAAILSDTLMFRSPTCTAVDKSEALKLAEIAGIDAEKFGTDMFSAGSDLRNKTVEEIFYQDFKKFTASDIDFGIGQINSFNAAELNEIKNRIEPFMERAGAEMGLKMVAFMLTDITNESTDLIFKGSKADEIIKKAYGDTQDINYLGSSILLKGVVSRKKQLVPRLIRGIQQLQ
ncbi:MAG: putative manganese-dependent inorganic diphosphatase [Candidatus Metalachnospira sp.]|nr:putative manganese-dependent inorganic diphosphatase [Candidatus Metalachnospira sp.]